VRDLPSSPRPSPLSGKGRTFWTSLLTWVAYFKYLKMWMMVNLIGSWAEFTSGTVYLSLQNMGQTVINPLCL
jgi:hypothetical protein